MKLSKKYEYLKFLQPFDKNSYTNPNIVFAIKNFEPLLQELFSEQDDSIYIKPISNIEELKNDAELKHLELIQTSHAAIKITNYIDRGIYLLFNENFYISCVYYVLTNKGLEIVKTLPYYSSYKSENLLKDFLFYIYEGITYKNLN